MSSSVTYCDADRQLRFCERSGRGPAGIAASLPFIERATAAWRGRRAAYPISPCMVQSMDARHTVTEQLIAWRRGDENAFNRLIALVYDELLRIAHAQLRREDSGHTLSTTGLVHETYLRLIDTSRVQWRDRVHFFGVTATVMRRVLVDHARQIKAAKRGGGAAALSLDETELAAEERANALVALDEALTRLTAMDERLGRVVEYRFFGGLSEEETAEVLGVSARTVRRDWVKAKGWLHQELRECQE